MNCIAHRLLFNRHKNGIKGTVYWFADISHGDNIYISFKHFVKNQKQFVFIDRFVFDPMNDMIDLSPGIEKVFRHDAVAELCKLQGGHAIPEVMRKALHGAAVGVGEEPFEEAFLSGQFRANDGRSDVQEIGQPHLAQAFGFAINIQRVMGIVFGVVAFATAVNAIGGDGQDAGPGAVLRAGFREKVGKEGIDHNGVLHTCRIIIFAPRLDNADAVDDVTGLEAAGNIFYLLFNLAGSIEMSEVFVVREWVGAEKGSEYFVIFLFIEVIEQHGTEHPVDAHYQDFHHFNILWHTNDAD